MYTVSFMGCLFCKTAWHIAHLNRSSRRQPATNKFLTRPPPARDGGDGKCQCQVVRIISHRSSPKSAFITSGRVAAVTCHPDHRRAREPANNTIKTRREGRASFRSGSNQSAFLKLFYYREGSLLHLSVVAGIKRCLPRLGVGRWARVTTCYLLHARALLPYTPDPVASNH